MGKGLRAKGLGFSLEGGPKMKKKKKKKKKLKWKQLEMDKCQRNLKNLKSGSRNM